MINECSLQLDFEFVSFIINEKFSFVTSLPLSARFFKMHHYFREANKYAYALATKGPPLDLEIMHFDSLPMDLCLPFIL